MGISVKILVLGPLIRSIICHYYLLLMGKPSMTGIILTFPGMQTKTSVCRSTNTAVTVRARVPTLHTVAQWTTPITTDGALSLITFTGRDPGGIPLDVRIHHFSSHPSLPQPATLQPALHCSPWADYFGLSLWQEKGARESTLGTAIAFGFGAT